MSNDADEPVPAAPSRGERDEDLADEYDETPSRSQRENDRLADRIGHQFAQQWAVIRSERRGEPGPIRTGPSNFSRAQVPWGVDLAAAWAWRVIVIGVAGLALWRIVSFLAVITLPLVVALLLAALASPLVRAGHRIGVPRGVAAFVVVVGGLALVSLLFTFVGQQVATGSTDLANQVVAGLGEIRTWLQTGPLHASDSQINTWIAQTQDEITKRASSGNVLQSITEFGAALGHVLAGLFIVLFSTYFFLADGDRIWAWVVRLAPRAARGRVDSSGRIAWISLTRFVRATVIVALTDALGVMVAASILGVPLIAAIGVVVFLGAFVPMLGALVAGTVAVLVALVAQGPLTALFMLIGVVVVQQFESHVLQPFLMGRWVSVHPLGVILSIGIGVLVAGVAGALVAVPLAAAVNAVVQHLATYTKVGENHPDALLSEDLARD